MLVPKILTTLRAYDRAQFLADLGAGAIVGIVALQLAIMGKETITELRRTPRVLIIRMRNVPAMDSTGLNALRDVVGRFRRAGARVILSDVHAQPMVALQRSALADEIAEDDGNINDAFNVARAHLGLATVPRPEFAVPTVAREDRRRQPRPPG